MSRDAAFYFSIEWKFHWLCILSLSLRIHIYFLRLCFNDRLLNYTYQRIPLITEKLSFSFTVAALIYWRDPKKSGIVFGATLAVLLSLAYFSLISVVAYISLLTLTFTVAFRIYKTVLQAIQKTSDGHPFKWVSPPFSFLFNLSTSLVSVYACAAHSDFIPEDATTKRPKTFPPGPPVVLFVYTERSLTGEFSLLEIKNNICFELKMFKRVELYFKFCFIIIALKM